MEDEMKLMPMFNNECEISQSTITCSAYDIYLDEEIKDPTYYRKAFHVLRSAQPGDLVRIYISTYGGNLTSAIMFKNCIEGCQADVVAIIEGEAYSAGSLIALSCPNIEVKPYATMMCHSAAFSSGGHVGSIRDHVDFVGRHAEGIMEDVYKDFLYENELEDLRRGRDIWLNAEEIAERLDRMFEARQEDGCGNPECEGCSGEDEGFDLDKLIEDKVQEAINAAMPKEEKPKPSRKRPSRAKKTEKVVD